MSALTKREQYIRIKDEYRKAHDNAPARTRVMLDWAIGEGLYAVDESAALRRDAEEFANVLRTQTVKDADGEDARINHSYGTAQGHLWDDYRTITHENMQLSYAQTRNRIFGEVKHEVRGLKLYHDYHQDRPRIQFSFNFNNDLADEGLLSPFSNEIERLVEPSPRVRQK